MTALDQKCIDTFSGAKVDLHSLRTDQVSAQLMERARRGVPGLEAGFEAGEFAPLLAWLRELVHRHGRKLTPDELVERATGGQISAAAYIRDKFAGLYGLS